jgi:carboxyl-terminal processing protease
MKLRLKQCLLIPVVLILIAGCATTQSQLQLAAWAGDTETVEELLAKGADVNSKNTQGKTALMIAAEKGHIEIVQVLLSAGADVNTKDNRGRTAFRFASEKGHKAIVRALVAEGSVQVLSEVIAVIQRGHIEEHTAKELVTYAIEGMERRAERKQYETGEVKLDWEGTGDDRVTSFRLFEEAYDFYRNATDIPPEKLLYDAIGHMVETADPHSVFLTPEEYREMQVDTRAEFGGAGMQIGIRNSVLTVIEPIDDTPAFRAGIQAGDKILKIDGQPTKDITTLTEAVKRLRGRLGTVVTLTIKRGMEESFDVTMTREVINIKSVKSEVIKENIGYVRIAQFQQDTAADLGKHLGKLVKDDNITSLILDLRNNSGGLFKSTVEVTSKFLPEDRLAVYIQGRKGGRNEYRTGGTTPTTEMPMVVLVNKGTAAGSEIVAAALQDHDRATILGSPTFGRASIQSVVPLSDGSGLRITTARFYTPKGRSIQGKGINPDILVELPQSGSLGDLVSDTQLQQAVEILTTRDRDRENREM